LNGFVRSFRRESDGAPKYPCPSIVISAHGTLVIDCPDGSVAAEAETRLIDLQALERRISLKRRDSGIQVVILLVNDTLSNRRVLRAQREGLRSSFPLDGRQTLGAVRSGRRPTASGIVVL
jgi:hypothetical protein